MVKYDYDLAKDFAETIAGLHRKMDEICDITGWEIYETFSDADSLYYVFLRMVDGTVCDHSSDSFGAFVRKELSFDELLAEVTRFG